jgi:hypothetical protein
MKTRFILIENNVDFLLNFLNKENYKYASTNPYANEIIMQDVKENLLKDKKDCVALSSLELNEDDKTYTITTKFYTGNDELMEVVKNLKVNENV